MSRRRRRVVRFLRIGAAIAEFIRVTMPSAKVVPTDSTEGAEVAATPDEFQKEGSKPQLRRTDTEAVADAVTDALPSLTSLTDFWDVKDLEDDIASPAGVLTFNLHNGKDLMPADRNGLSDPYAIVRVNTAKTWRSRKCMRTLNPEWEHTHEFQGYLTDLVRKPIKIRIYDWDMVSLNDPIGRCAVDISALSGYGKENGLRFDDVPLTGVPHGTISFSLHFELKPVFALFPGTPVHASAAQALRRRPPPDASRTELLRDGLLRLLSRKLFLYFAVLWLLCLVTTIGFIVVLYIAIYVPVIGSIGTAPPANETLPWATWARDAQIVGLTDDELMYWCNVCFQVCTALFSYLNFIVIPWRVSIAAHHLSKRNSAPVRDIFSSLYFAAPLLCAASRPAARAARPG